MYQYICMCVTVLATVSCCGRVKASAGNHRALFVKYKDFVELEKNIYFHMYIYPHLHKPTLTQVVSAHKYTNALFALLLCT